MTMTWSPNMSETWTPPSFLYVHLRLLCSSFSSTSFFLRQAGLFSAVTTTFIVQIIPQLQPNPVDLTNVLLLRILQQNTSFGGTTYPLAPVSNIPTGVLRAQPILFASLSVTLFVAFIAVLGKQWIHYYTRVTTWGNIVDRGREHQTKLVGLQRWGFHLIMESLPAMLQFALLLFGVALTVYHWDLNVSVAEVVLVVTSVGFAFYACVAVIATIWRGCPFQTPLSVVLQVLLPGMLHWAKEFISLARIWLRHWWKRRSSSFLLWTARVTERGRLARSLGFKAFTDEANIPNNAAEGGLRKPNLMTLSNPAFWRRDPLFASSIKKDIAASAGFWLLENSTDHSVASAVAAVFPEFQWPSHLRSTTALIRLRDMYAECFRAPEFDRSTRLKALQSAAAYYVLHHTQLIWSTSKSLEVETEILRDLPTDLLLHQHTEEWGGDDVFEHLLRIEDRSEPVTSARFLSYIAPYWFCGDSDATIRFRPSRLQTLNELIEVLEKSQALTPATVTDCVLCTGAAVDLPLHPEDLIRVDKRWVVLLNLMLTVKLTWGSDYCQQTFKTVIEHIHGIILSRGRRRRYAEKALGILFTLVKKTTLPLVDAAWINELLKSAAGGDMDDEKFTLFMRFNARRKEEEAIADVGATPGQDRVHIQGGINSPIHGETVPSESPTPEYTLFNKIMQNVRTCIGKESGSQDEAVYGGLIAIKDIPRLGTCLPEGDSLQTLSKAMEKEESKPLRVRKAAYDIVVVARDGWLKSTALRSILEDLDIPRKLHSVVIETNRPHHQRSFLEMMEILSEDRYWHPYLRGAMDIWLPLRHEGQGHVLRILAAVGELLLPGWDGSKPPDKPLEKIVEDEWAGVPGRLVMDLTADRLKPLAEVTKQVKELLFTESDRRSVLGVVERVVPSLEKRRDDGYDGPGEDIRCIVGDLIEMLRIPTGRRPAYR